MDEQELINQARLKARLFLPFERVQFVTPTEENKCETEAGPSKEGLFSLDGKDAKEFYELLTSVESKVESTSISESKPKVTKFAKVNCKSLLKKTSKHLDKTETSKKEKNLLKYAHYGELKNIQQLVAESSVNIDTRDQFGWTPLMCAVCAGHRNVVEFLLQHNANRELKNDQNLTALDLAQKSNVSLDIINLLITFRSQTLHTKKVEQKSVVKSSYCASCKVHYTEESYLHKRSIVHLFSSSKKTEPRTFYHIPEHNKGFQIMLKRGWDKNQGLGPSGQGQKFPVKTILKQDRSCLGSDKKEKERITHFGPHDTSAVKKYVQSPKPAIVREKTLKKWQREKMQRIKRQKEIAFRRQFNC